MELLIQYWDLLLILSISVVGFVFIVKKWLSTPSSAKKEQMRAVLLQLVVLAEKEMGSSTGAIKRSIVISKLYSQFTWLKYIPVTLIDELINESLVFMRKMIESNDKVKVLIDSE